MSPNSNDPDPGQPLLMLKEQEQETSSRFVDKVRGRILRRTAASQVANYSWFLPGTALLEMARVLTHFLQSFGTNKDPQP